MFNKNALKISLLFSLVEIIVFIGLSILSSKDANIYPNSKPLFAIILQNLPNMFIALATTWYVVFTYYILKSNEIIRKISSEPFLLLNWLVSQEKAPFTFKRYLDISNKIATAAGLVPKDIGNVLNRYVNLNIQNVHGTKLGSILVGLEVTFKMGDSITDVNTLDWECKNINIGVNEVIAVTALDLKAIPRGITINFRIANIQYQAVDSDKILAEFSGTREFSAQGIAVFEEISLTPQKEEL